MNQNVKSIFASVAVILFFVSPSICFYIYDEWTSFRDAVFYISLRILLVWLLFELIEHIGRRWIKIALLVILFPSFLVEMVFLYGYKTFISISGIFSLFKTTASEALEFSILFSVAYFVIIVSYLFFSYLYLNHSKPIFSCISSFNTKIFILGSLFLLLFFENTYANKTNPLRLSTKNNFKLKIVKHFPFNFYYRVYEKFLYDKKSREFFEVISTFKFNSVLIDDKEKKTVVLIIGETQRHDLYMKEFEVVKQQLSFFTDSNTFFLPRMYSIANSTAYSFPMIITRATAQTQDLLSKEPSIVSLYREAGYKTFWLANQNLFLGPDASFYGKEVDEFYPLWKEKADDRIVLPILKSILADTCNRKFIAICIKGNHYRYSYPVDFDYHRPNLNSDNVYAFKLDNKSYFMNSYLNTARFQLNFLDSIHSLVAECKQSTAILFISDHGESIFEAPDYFFGHGTAKVPIEQVHCFSYLSFNDQFRSSEKNMVSSLNNNKGKAATVENVFYTLAELGNISFAKHDSTMSIVNLKNAILCM